MALKGYELITQDLTEFEKNTIVPLLVRGLSRPEYLGKSNAIKNKSICAKVNSNINIKFKYKLTDVKCRKIIQYIRLHNLIIGLCSCQQGYYVASNRIELEECVKSLTQRLNIQKKVRDGLANNLLTMYDRVDLFKKHNNIA